ncbi:BURP domain protein RD22-like [Rutidosis leptorrhynchoides]|uniref:BURP domain protein RD22-like n=1 Tax=Rutidosis leptorrhynchoides TaxID=125765 RepID=UPI003A9A1D27
MKFLHIITFFSLSVIVSHATDVAPDIYWKSVLPNTPIPKAVSDLLEIDTPHGASKPFIASVSEQDAKKEANHYHGLRKEAVYRLLINFFLEKDMYQGHNLDLQFPKTKTPFLARKVAETIPFSSKNLPEIYTHFSIKPDSIESETMKKTITQCEYKGREGETEYCATSLEDMVDFTTSELGKKVKAITTEVYTNKVTPLQKYAIIGATKLATSNFVACHKLKYPHAVYYCHKDASTRLYSISLVGEDGTKVRGLAICHKYVADMYPKDMVFKVLKVKPGSAPICHVLPEDHVVWVPY